MTAVVRGKNPFDDDDDDNFIGSTNPFDDSVDETNDDDDDHVIMTMGDNAVSGGDVHAAVEASWQYLGDLPYRRVPLYDNVDWDGGLTKLPANMNTGLDARELMTTKVTGCPNGGPIAVLTVPILGGVGSTQNELRILTSSGRLLASKMIDGAKLMTMGFTSRTTLVVILQDSTCLTFDLSGNEVLPPFAILPEAKEIVLASVFDGGAAVLSGGMHVGLVELFDQHDDTSYADTAHLGSYKVTSPNKKGDYALITPLSTASSQSYYRFVTIAVLSRSHTKSRHPEVFLSTDDNSVVVIDSATGQLTDVDCRARIVSPIIRMSFAPNGRFLALFSQDSILTVISTSFETKVLDFDTSEGSSTPPLDIQWCGEDSVVLHWRNLGVLMVGPYGDWLRFPYENTDNLHILPEIDCCRVVTDHSMEILQRVPPATALMLRIASIEASAMLLDASDAFESGSPSSDEAARAITRTGLLMEAIETCTEAATKEFDIDLQKRLLKAASYGMHFAYKDPSDTRTVLGGSPEEEENSHTRPSPTAMIFVNGARKLRVLNALRSSSVGFPLTASQYDRITPIGVVARLVAMKRPSLAAAIASYLGLPGPVQIYARARKAATFCASDKNHTDSQTAEAAKAILEGDGSISSRGGYATVALEANRAGRPGVATLLLLSESSVVDKVPALMSIGSYADAVAVATTARDPDLIFDTLMEFEKHCMADPNKGQSDFLGTVVNKFTNEGYHTLRRSFASMDDVKIVMNLLLRAQKFTAAGLTMARKAMENSEETKERDSQLKEASRVFGLGKDTGFEKACTDEHMDLLADQQVLRNKYGSDEVAPDNASVMDTIYNVICFAAVNRLSAHKLLTDAEKLARKFRVSEKRFWHVKVRAFADSDQWASLRNLAESKKPPIGYKPFALAAIKGQQGMSEILRYIDRITVPEQRYDLFCTAKLWQRAAEEAARLKDAPRLFYVSSVCNDPEVKRVCEDLATRMQ